MFESNVFLIQSKFAAKIRFFLLLVKYLKSASKKFVIFREVFIAQKNDFGRLTGSNMEEFRSIYLRKSRFVPHKQF